jgi:hypothetical protein
LRQANPRNPEIAGGKEMDGYQIPGEELNAERRLDTAALTQIHKKNRAAANRTEREKKRRTPAPRKTRSVGRKILRAARKWPAEEPCAREVTRNTKVKSRHGKQHGGENNLGDETKNQRAEAKSPSKREHRCNCSGLGCSWNY